MLRLIFIYILLSIYSFSFADSKGSITGFDIPRYVSLKSDDVNLRKGSSINYPILIKYNVKNLPVKILEEYNDWRQIEDFYGHKGWIHKSLLKGERYGIIDLNLDDYISIRRKPNGKTLGFIGKNNVVKINTCLVNWCNIVHDGNEKGWIEKIYLWGVFKDEQINTPIYQPIINQIWKINFFN